MDMMDYYRKELNINMLDEAKVLDGVKKNLQKVADVMFGFDASCRLKAQELVYNWKRGVLLARNILIFLIRKIK
ncbi:7066_t:CDS:2 [Paraglomus brasilianum]|uniref:7066_t:CDS:1 n=1 Tax=Paraglomus brasilianum TaxID=144538 RepID=A0A9N8YWF6_9GLOM|nr:7066_t:CDS:2 [Paraglomus brasilianum]